MNKDLFKWIGVVVLPLPVANLISTLIRIFGSMFVEPDDDWPKIVAQFAFGALLSIIPGWLAPKYKTRTAYISAAVYFFLGISSVIFCNARFLDTLPSFIGLVVGGMYVENELDKKTK